MTEVSAQQLKEKIADLQKEHRELDIQLDNMVNDPLVDDLTIQQLKRKKLMLKDSIASMRTERAV